MNALVVATLLRKLTGADVLKANRVPSALRNTVPKPLLDPFRASNGWPSGLPIRVTGLGFWA